MKDPLLAVGYYKGEMDFEISGTVQTLSIEELYELRNMIIVAIWQAEDSWRRKRPDEAGSCQINKEV